MALIQSQLILMPYVLLFSREAVAPRKNGRIQMLSPRLFEPAIINSGGFLIPQLILTPFIVGFKIPILLLVEILQISGDFFT